MIVYKVTANALEEGSHFPLYYDYGTLGENECCEWHESLDLQLLRFNNIRITEKVDRGTTIECSLFMAKLPKKEYKRYREEYEKEGYSEIAENSINYDWTIVTSKKFKL
jgi:hypothetical protein